MVNEYIRSFLLVLSLLSFCSLFFLRQYNHKKIRFVCLCVFERNGSHKWKDEKRCGENKLCSCCTKSFVNFYIFNMSRKRSWVIWMNQQQKRCSPLPLKVVHAIVVKRKKWPRMRDEMYLTDLFSCFHVRSGCFDVNMPRDDF